MEVKLTNTNTKAASNRVRLNKKTVARHVVGRRVRVWDTDLSALYLQITPAGSSSYCLRYEKLGGTKGDFTIGSTATLSPEIAREAGKAKLAAHVLNGTDPVEARREARRDARKNRFSTFGDLVEQYLEKQSLAPRTLGTRMSSLRRHLLPRFGDRPYAEISRKEIKAALQDIQADIARRRADFKKSTGGTRAANVCHDILKVIFNWGIDQEICETNPAQFDNMFNDTPVKRINALNEERLRNIWNALDKVEVGSSAEQAMLGIKLHYLTLQRPYEIIRANAADFDWPSSTWRPHKTRTKTKMDYFVPLSPEAKSLFQRLFEISEGEWAYPWKRNSNVHANQHVLYYRYCAIREELLAKNILDRADIDLYDGRRFGRTQLVKTLKFSKEIAEMVINHKQAQDISNLYDVEDYTNDVRMAQVAWTGEVLRIAGGAARLQLAE
jgi:integrase